MKTTPVLVLCLRNPNRGRELKTKLLQETWMKDAEDFLAGEYAPGLVQCSGMLLDVIKLTRWNAVHW